MISIENFAKNLEALLMTPPLKEKMVLALDPAYLTGCKLAGLDKNGNPWRYLIGKISDMSVEVIEPAKYTIHYVANGGSGVMPDQSIELGETTTLTANRFINNDAAFVEWNTEPDGSGTQYGAQESIAIVDDLSTEGKEIYAQWVASEGNMQTWNSCSTMQIGDVTALTDTRDNQTYAVAKLADGNCWMTDDL